MAVQVTVKHPGHNRAHNNPAYKHRIASQTGNTVVHLEVLLQMFVQLQDGCNIATPVETTKTHAMLGGHSLHGVALAYINLTTKCTPAPRLDHQHIAAPLHNRCNFEKGWVSAG